MILRFFSAVTLLWSLASSVYSQTSPSVTQINTSILQIQHRQWQPPSDLHEHRETRLHYDRQGQSSGGHLLFSYQPLRVSGHADIEQPAHNGHLYEYGVGVRRQWQTVALELDTGAHISSNMFIHRQFHSDALVTTFRLWAGQGAADWRPGLAGDYRFGRFLLYPRLQTGFAVGSGEVMLDLPVSLIWRSGNGQFSAGMERYGQKWGVLDSERELESRLYHSEWRLQAGWHLPAGWRNSQLDLALGVSVGRQMRFTSTSNRVQRYRPGNSVYASIAVSLPRQEFLL